MLRSQRVCHLHIGTRKTSTTSIQTALAENRDLLERRGVWYPPGLTSNQRELAFAAGAVEKMAEYRPILGAAFLDDAQSSRGKIIDVLQQWSVRSALPSIVFSAEDLSKLELGHISEIRDILRLFDVDVRVYCFLRSQWEYALSNISTISRNGGVMDSVQDAFSDGVCKYYRLNYRELLQDWIEVFGRDAMTVDLFRNRGDGERGVVARFMQQIQGVGSLAGGEEPRENAALGSSAIAFLLSMNRAGVGLDPQLGKSASRWKLERLVDAASVHSGSRWCGDGDFLQGFAARFAESNEWVRQNFFPDLAPGALFDPPLREDEGDATLPALIDDRLARFSGEVFERILAEVQAAEGKAEYLWGRLQLTERQPGEALAAFDRALRDLPDSAAVQFYRAHALYQLGRLPEAHTAISMVAALDPAGDLPVGDLLSTIEQSLRHKN